MPASCVTVQVGQCGNQLGAKLLDRLARDFADEAEADYFFRAPADPKHPHRVARSVLVDTEPRAIGAARGGARKGRRWAYGGRSRVCCDAGLRGCANNWARGFSAPEEEVARAGDALRREAERCDALDALFFVGSGGGGTGSGLGCALATAAPNLQRSCGESTNCAPVTVTSVPPSSEPATGDTSLTEGAWRYVKRTAAPLSNE